jgi:hypothetical protein
MASLQQQFATEFDTLTKLDATQVESKLRKICRVRNIQAKTATFNRMGTMRAYERIIGSPIQTQDVAQSNVTVSVVDLDVATEIGDVDLDKVVYDVKMELAQQANRAMQNRLDQIIINAINTGASTTVSVGADGTNWTLANMATLATEIDSRNFVGQKRYFVVHPKSINKAIRTPEVSSSDYSTLMALMGNTGDLNGKTYLGFEFLVIGDLDTTERGLPYVSGTGVRSNFAVVGEGAGAAVGLAFSRDIRSKVEWLPERQSWMILSTMSVGAVAIGSTEAGKEGIYKYSIDEIVA